MYYDFHTHLDMYDRIEPIIKEINDKEIFTISASVDVDSYARNKEISYISPLIIPTFGIHPSMAVYYENRLAELDNYIMESPIIGEIGLDYLWVDPLNKDAQKKVFRYIAKKAVSQDKYIVIHTKNAEHDILDILTELKAEKVIVHWYSGPEDIFNEYLSKGWYFTYGVELEFSELIRSYVAKTPLNRLLAETDNPVGIEWFSDRIGKPNEILGVYTMITEIKKIGISKLNQLIEINSKRILNR